MSTPNDPYGYNPYGQPPSYPPQPKPAYQTKPRYPPPQGLQDPDPAMGIGGLIQSVLGCDPL
ncbi:CD225/dispanin family protein, partial [Mycobacterium kansasii]